MYSIGCKAGLVWIKEPMIETARLRLIPCELKHFEALLNNPPQLEAMLGVSTAKDWLSFPEAISHGYEYLKANPNAHQWWMHLFIHKEDNRLIGCGGYKGEADDAGMVEIGYEIAPAYRNRRLATEAAEGMIAHAFSHPHIKMVDAHTLAETNHSTRVLEKVGMKNIGTTHDPDDGETWHWRLNR